MTNNSHFNPCFWTAFWNEAYFDSTAKGGATNGRPRDQILTYYSIQAGKILEAKASAVHKHYGIGSAEFTHGSAMRYSQGLRDLGEILPNIPEWSQRDSVYLDAETWFSGLEGLPIYRAVIEVVLNGRIKSVQEKMDLAAFFVIHNERIHAAWAALPNRIKQQKDHNLEHILLMRRRLSDQKYLFEKVLPIGIGAWYLHEFDSPALLLGDYGFPIVDGMIWAAISPRHLIVVDTTRQIHAHLIPNFDRGDAELAERYNREMMRLSKREIVGPKEILQKYKK